jgi:hypothetical protein
VSKRVYELELVGLEVGLEGMNVMLLQVVTQWRTCPLYMFFLPHSKPSSSDIHTFGSSRAMAPWPILC